MRIQAVAEDTKKVENTYTRVQFVERKGDDRLIQDGRLLVLEMSVEAVEKYTARKFILLVRRMIASANRHRLSHITCSFSDICLYAGEESVSVQTGVERIVVNAEMANYRFTAYKEKPKEGWGTVTHFMLTVPKQEKKNAVQSVKNAEIIAEGVNRARDLANTPGGHMTPELLVSETKKMVRGTNVKLRVLGEAEMKKIGMGGVLGVAQGSSARPRFLVLEYHGAPSKKNPIVLVGKGVTYDSGGLDIKPSPYGMEMKMDMSGAAAVIASLVAAATLGVEKHIIGLVPAVENMPSGESFRPGDILKSLSGKTIEVLNTDAEGRIILADALTYAERYKPSLVVDVATLTGAAEVVLGKRASVICTPDAELAKQFQELGEESGDYVWPLPLWEEYEADVQGVFGDVANMNTKGDWREAGTISAAIFLYQFAKKFPKWLHIDMASRMVPVHDEYLAKGAAGAPVRLLVHLLRSV